MKTLKELTSERIRKRMGTADEIDVVQCAPELFLAQEVSLLTLLISQYLIFNLSLSQTLRTVVYLFYDSIQ